MGGIAQDSVRASHPAAPSSYPEIFFLQLSARAVDRTHLVQGILQMQLAAKAKHSSKIFRVNRIRTNR